MNSNIGHSIKSLIDNCPVQVSTNSFTSTVTTRGGNVYQAGLVGKQVQKSFEKVQVDKLVGKVVETVSTDDKIYMLNTKGSVFEYDFQTRSCSPIVVEVYSPELCCGDKAIHIVSGSKHILILTEKGKVFGVGLNNEYQIKPYGQCDYKVAEEIIVTNYNLHDQKCCKAFTGTIVPQTVADSSNACDKSVCLKGTVPQFQVGFVTTTVNISSPNPLVGVNVNIPVYAAYEYSGTLCVDSEDMASGTITLTPTGDRSTIYYTPNGEVITTTVGNFTFSLTVNLEVGYSETSARPAAMIIPITRVKCNQLTSYNIARLLPASYSVSPNNITRLNLGQEPFLGFLTLSNGVTFTPLDSVSTTVQFTAGSVDIKIPCCKSKCNTGLKCKKDLEQPCWTGIYAGFNTSVLLDNCNRLYVLGSIHQIRNNKHLLGKDCQEDLINKYVNKITLPADQLNCSTKIRNGNCLCNKCCDDNFKTDLSKFNIELKFDSSCTTVNACDFLKAIKKCNEQQSCRPTDKTCDPYIYLSLASFNGSEECCYYEPVRVQEFRIFNKRSICKAVSSEILTYEVDVDLQSTVDFDYNKFCVNGVDVCLEKVLVLRNTVEPLMNSGPIVDIYVDLDNAGGIQFSNGSKYNQEFTASTGDLEFAPKRLINFGSVLDPVEFSNLKKFYGYDAYFPYSEYLTIDNLIVNTYVKGGDHVRFIKNLSNGSVRQAVTPDLPTVFKFNRKVVDVAVGENNLSVIGGGLKCANEVYALGENAYGQLGIHSNETTVCWKSVNTCVFDCQVKSVFAGQYVTFYITQSGRVYASGYWKHFNNTNAPLLKEAIPSEWGISQISISENQIILLSELGLVFGFGDNKLGELGLCHDQCVYLPSALTFFHKLNSHTNNLLRYTSEQQQYEQQPPKKHSHNRYNPNNRLCCNKKN